MNPTEHTSITFEDEGERAFWERTVVALAGCQLVKMGDVVEQADALLRKRRVRDRGLRTEKTEGFVLKGVPEWLIVSDEEKPGQFSVYQDNTFVFSGTWPEIVDYGDSNLQAFKGA